MFNADAEWSQQGKCTPNDSTCPQAPDTKPEPDDAGRPNYAGTGSAAQLEMEFLYNGGASARFQVQGSTRCWPRSSRVARKFWWINHTYTHASGWAAEQDFSVGPLAVRAGRQAASTGWASLRP